MDESPSRVLITKDTCLTGGHGTGKDICYLPESQKSEMECGSGQGEVSDTSLLSAKFTTFTVSVWVPNSSWTLPTKCQWHATPAEATETLQRSPNMPKGPNCPSGILVLKQLNPYSVWGSQFLVENGESLAFLARSVSLRDMETRDGRNHRDRALKLTDLVSRTL